MTSKRRLSPPYGHEQRGYFAFPLTEDDLELEDFDGWQTASDLVEAAKAGRLEIIPSVLAHYDSDESWGRALLYSFLIGSAGSDALLERILHELQTGLPAHYSWDFVEMLGNWGRLDIVPTFIRGWRATYQYDDSETIPDFLSTLLEPSPGPLQEYPEPRAVNEAGADAYCELALARHAELAEQLGERAFVFHGRLLDLEWIARNSLDLLSRLSTDWRIEYMFRNIRHKFEAMTGIDCSPFYDDRSRDKLQPLAAAAIFEDFLASPTRHDFIPGKRYFFGHPIPPGDPIGAKDWPPR